MYLKQYYLDCLAHASYMVVDQGTGMAVVVDPQRDVDQYVHDAADQGWTIGHVLLTHCHADFLAGHLELRQQTGAEIHMGARARTEFPMTPMTEVEPLVLGSTRLRFLETPGHTPESVCILVDDLEKDAERPQAVLTGDTLFIGDVGRPDLFAAADLSAEELAGQLHDSLHTKLLTLPDETLVYPAHGAGSMCGKNLSSDTVSTIGAQRATNPALQDMSRAAFIAMVTSGQPAAPAYFALDAQLNRQEHPTLEESLARSLEPLSLVEFLAAQKNGARIIDVRDPHDYCRKHLQGSMNIGLGGKYATWAGSLLDSKQPLVILAEHGRERQAALRLGRIGFDTVRGYLEGGPAALTSPGAPTTSLERIDGHELQRRMQASEPPLLLDVRSPAEHAAWRMPGSLNVPLSNLEERMAELPQDRHMVVSCLGGYRSTIACSMLEARGYDRLTDLAGGIQAWPGPTESGRGSHETD